MELGEQIKSLRLKAGLNQTDLGFCLSENPSTATSMICKIERNKRKLSLAELHAISSRLNIQPGELIEHEPTNLTIKIPRSLNPNSKTAKARELGISKQALHQREHPEQTRARGRSHYNRNNGKKVLFECACDVEKKEEHHPDYSKPLEVVVCCHACHMREHARIRAYKKELS